MSSPQVPAKDRRRFVILAHERPDGDVHYDLLVESTDAADRARGSAAEASGREPPEAAESAEAGPARRKSLCFTWSFAEPPAHRQQRCRRIFDHPGRFLTYEGPLREGRGRVRRYDAGTCLLEGHPAQDVVLALAGATVTGAFRLHRVSEAGPTDERADPPDEGEYLWQPLD